MKAIVYDAPRSYAYRDVPEPELTGNDVLIQVKGCGLCGTDLHIHEGEFGPRFPLIPGHEFTGEIAAVGDGVTAWQPGDRVVANCNRSCGGCFYCRRGQYLLCERLEAYGIQMDGGFAEFMRVHAGDVFRVNKLSWREAIMVEPTACAVHGVEVLGVKPGADVLLFGAGPTGQVLAQLLKYNGAATLTVAAPAGPKLALAERLSADRVVAVDRHDPEKHRRALQEISPHGFDYVVEATGAPNMCEEALRQVRRGGEVLIYGVYPEGATASFNPFDVFRREITIKGSFAQIDTFDRALAYLENGKVRVNEIVTDEFELKDWGRALEGAWQRRGIKTMMMPPGS